MSSLLEKNDLEKAVNMKNLLFFVVDLLFLGSESHGAVDNKTECEPKEKGFALLDVAEDLISKAKLLYPTCKDDTAVLEDSGCRTKEKSFTYLELTKKVILELKEHFKTCKDSKPIDCRQRPRDCSEVLSTGQNRSGVYTVWPMSRFTASKSVDVYCDMDTDGGGWT
ncbi:piggyBac transposable element-derived protein 4, partial [Caerostris darwini]